MVRPEQSAHCLLPVSICIQNWGRLSFGADSQSRRDVRLSCLAAIDVAQSRPLVKAALFGNNLDGHARVGLLRAFEKEPRLLAAVDLLKRDEISLKHIRH